jgi:hypothetical protein
MLASFLTWAHEYQQSDSTLTKVFEGSSKDLEWLTLVIDTNIMFSIWKAPGVNPPTAALVVMLSPPSLLTSFAGPKSWRVTPAFLFHDAMRRMLPEKGVCGSGELREHSRWDATQAARENFPIPVLPGSANPCRLPASHSCLMPWSYF